MSTVGKIGVLGSADTKGPELAFLAGCIRERGATPEILDTSPDQWVPNDGSRASIMEAASKLIAEEVVRRWQEGNLDGIVAIGGATGASLATESLHRLPLGIPKLLVSPVVAGETASLVDTSDLVMVAPVVDFVGRNAYADQALQRAAAIAVSLVREGGRYPDARSDHVAVTAFGVTSPLVIQLGEALGAEDTRMAVFSANGTGGRAYERFLAEDRVFGAFDITTSELADELFGGVLPAGSERLRTAASRGLPQVVLPGALDFINFREESTVPERFAGRVRVAHTSSVTLVRTSAEENATLARTMAERISPGLGHAMVIVPTKGFSLLSAPEGPFWDPVADAAFTDTLIDRLGRDAVTTVDAPINSAEVCAEILEATANWRRSGRVASG